MLLIRLPCCNFRPSLSVQIEVNFVEEKVDGFINFLDVLGGSRAVGERRMEGKGVLVSRGDLGGQVIGKEGCRRGECPLGVTARCGKGASYCPHVCKHLLHCK